MPDEEPSTVIFAHQGSSGHTTLPFESHAIDRRVTASTASDTMGIDSNSASNKHLAIADLHILGRTPETDLSTTKQRNRGWLPGRDTMPMSHVRDGNLRKMRLCSAKKNMVPMFGRIEGQNAKSGVRAVIRGPRNTILGRPGRGLVPDACAFDGCNYACHP
ncbi:Uncharacterized protein HZ326_21796 [Fusarium oxysporum f. sp. albedinis]|nr:Uncharacterized protein HZ326_21796 [Fusarium oxysporum f. sp. albedinis]